MHREQRVSKRVRFSHRFYERRTRIGGVERRGVLRDDQRKVFLPADRRGDRRHAEKVRVDDVRRAPLGAHAAQYGAKARPAHRLIRCAQRADGQAVKVYVQPVLYEMAQTERPAVACRAQIDGGICDRVARILQCARLISLKYALQRV